LTSINVADDKFFALMDYERDLRDEDSDKAIDLIVEILKRETNPRMAAEALEDVISMETIDRIEREAAANKGFHDLPGGVCYCRASDELKARLDALAGKLAGNEAVQDCIAFLLQSQPFCSNPSPPIGRIAIVIHDLTPPFPSFHGRARRLQRFQRGLWVRHRTCDATSGRAL
jgi:predicted transcriptional regulator